MTLATVMKIKALVRARKKHKSSKEVYHRFDEIKFDW